MEDVEYLPQDGVGTPTLAMAYVATGVTVALLLAGIWAPGAAYFAGFPALFAIGFWASYTVRRQLRTRLTAAGIETRRVRTRFIAWSDIRDIQVVERVQVAEVGIAGSRLSGRQGSRSGGGARKVASIRVRKPSGRWRELPMPAVWENVPDPDFTDKAIAIRARWKARAAATPPADPTSSLTAPN